MSKAPRGEEVDSRFLTITALLLALLGAPAFFSLVQDPASQMATVVSPGVERNPASLSEDGIEGLHLSKNATLEVPCDNLPQVQEIQANFLRLKGTACAGSKLDEISVVNQSNGFTASVIFTADTKYTTDFIDLKDGENKLQIETIDKDGSKITRSFIVNKRAPASIKQ